MQQAQAALETAQQSRASLKLYAPISGVVSTVSADAGTVVGSGATILTILDDTTLNLPVQIDETEIAGVQAGQTAEVTLDAYDGQTFTGEVVRVSPGATQSSGISVFTATVTLPNPDGQLRSGMTAEAEIIQSQERGLLIPSRAIQTVRNRSYVRGSRGSGRGAGTRACHDRGHRWHEYCRDRGAGVGAGRDCAGQHAQHLWQQFRRPQQRFWRRAWGRHSWRRLWRWAMTAPALVPPEDSSRIPPVVDLRDVRKVYEQGEMVFEALKGVDVQIAQGEMVALMGPSGSGKTTLMQIIGLLDRPSEGSYHLAGRDVTTLSENERAEARNTDIGFVFQAFHLLPRLNLLENVEVPLTYAGVPAAERRDRALDVLRRVGLGDKARNLPRSDQRRAKTAGGGGARPGRTAPDCCWPTNRPGTSTPAPGRR